MHISRTVLGSVVLALSVGSAGTAVAALACHGPFYTGGTYDPVTSTCTLDDDQCADNEDMYIKVLTIDGTSCWAKYHCCQDPRP